ncbi:MAG: serine hydroxymethyltransferase [Phycisphaerae bacterium]
MKPPTRYDAIRRADPAVFDILAAEHERQHYTIELIASENHVSPAVLDAAGSVFTNKYAEGYPAKRYYGGCQHVDAVESLAIDRAKKLFGVDHANVQPHSGSQANQAVFLAALMPGDRILSLNLNHGGHLTHGMKVNISGKWFEVQQYGVSPRDERIDLAEVRRLALEFKPKLIITGASAYPRAWDWPGFAAVAAECGALLMADIAHVAGLIAVGLHDSPVPHAQFVTTTTHKTLRGPRGGLTMCQADWAKKIDSAIFPGLQGGPLVHVVAAKAVAFGEALRPDFRQYQQRVLENAKALAEALQSHGFRLVSGGTDNHLMLLDLRKTHPAVTGAMAEKWLEAAQIIVNKNMIPFDERKPMETSGLRIGTPAITTRGVSADRMPVIAGWIHRVIAAAGDERTVSAVAAEARTFCDQYPLPGE